MDGDNFASMSREDTVLLLPGEDTFLVGMKLYKLVQKLRIQWHSQHIDSQYSDSDLECLSTSNLHGRPTTSGSSGGSQMSSSSGVPPSSSKSSGTSFQSTSPSTPSSKPCSESNENSHCDQPPLKRARVSCEAPAFILPCFPPDVQKYIENDAFFTPQQRNKLIRESYRALLGHYRQQNKVVPQTAKHQLSFCSFQLLQEFCLIQMESPMESKELKQKMSVLQQRWRKEIKPAMVQFSKETGSELDMEGKNELGMCA